MKNPLFVIILICAALVLSPLYPQNSGSAYADGTIPVSKVVRVLNGNYDDGDSPKGNKPANGGEFLVVSEPLGNTAYGKVGYFKGHSELTVVSSNKYKTYIDFEFMATSDGDRLAVGVRGSNSTLRYPYELYQSKFAGKEININEWYKVSILFDYANELTTVQIADSWGNVILPLTQTSLAAVVDDIAGTPSHIRIRTYGNNSNVYIDNLIIKEDIVWPHIDSVAGSDGETPAAYTNNRIKLKMSADMDTVEPEHITLIRSHDNSRNYAEAVEVNGDEITVTLAKPLQSSSEYRLILSGRSKMLYRTLPLEDDLMVNFVTSCRDFDISDVIFTSDGTNVTCVANLENSTPSDASAVILMSAYDSSGKITGINFVTVMVEAADSAASAPLSLPVLAGGHVKVAAIRDFDTRTPLNNNIYTFKPN